MLLGLSCLWGSHFSEQEGKSHVSSASQISQEHQEDPCHTVPSSQVRPLHFAEPLAQDRGEAGRNAGKEKRESRGEKTVGQEGLHPSSCSATQVRSQALQPGCPHSCCTQ